MLTRLARVAVFYVGILALWQFIAAMEFWPPYLFPAPLDVWSALRKQFERGLLQEALQGTMTRMLIGYSVSVAAGLTVGIACATFRWFDDTFGTLVLGFQSLPSITWLPAAVLWFGLSERAIIFVVFMGSVFAVAISARDGVRTIPPLLRRAALTFGARRFQLYRLVVFPAMLPALVQGMKLGWSFAWRSLMAGELLFVTASLGHLLELGRELNNISLVFAIMGVIVLIGLAADRLVFGRAEAWVQERWGLRAR